MGVGGEYMDAVGLWSPRIPEPWENGAWHCPECGRVLVGQGRPGRFGLLRWELMTPAERVRDCLVHGSTLPPDQRGALTAEEVRARAPVVAAAAGRPWARRLRGAASLFELAHWLWWLRKERGDVEVDRLLYAIGLLLPAPGPRPPGPPLMYGPPVL